MTSTIEKVSAAIDAHIEPKITLSGDCAYVPGSMTRRAARAAIAAVLEDMREPSEGVLKAGHTTGDFDHARWDWSPKAMRYSTNRILQAMLTQYTKEVLEDD